MFSKLDANGNGVIERSEAAAHPQLADHFDAVDANHDGVITPDELRAAKALRTGARAGAAPAPATTTPPPAAPPASR
jgi:hypothetical protein